jgi:hypothetical protein
VTKFIILLCVFLAGGCATKVDDFSKLDQDLITLLVKKGANINKEHLVSFLIDCSTKQQVSHIMTDAMQYGFEDDYLSYSNKRQVWSTSLTKYIKLDLSEITVNRAKLTPLMPSKGCQPIFWGASVKL